jgi:DNA-directed RNA polymerase specialized sigma24 family protein
LETAPEQTANLDQLYRFALLLCGQARAAEQVLATALAEMQTQLSQVRSTGSRLVWLVARIRQECQRRAPGGETGYVPGLIRVADEDVDEAEPLLAIEAYLFARRFSTLPEPGRSALALFYLDLFPLAEICGLLNLTWDRYCETLKKARASLREGVQQMRMNVPV